jgi:hypothetical protein
VVLPLLPSLADLGQTGCAGKGLQLSTLKVCYVHVPASLRQPASSDCCYKAEKGVQIVLYGFKNAFLGSFNRNTQCVIAL